MKISFLCTSSLEYPSPRGRWWPLACELAKRGHEPQLIMLHHTYAAVPVAKRHELRHGVVLQYVGQMHVYGPVGQRQYFGLGELIRVSLQSTVALLRATLRTGCDLVHVCKPQPINGLAGLLAARLLRRPLYIDCDDYEAGGNRFSAAWQMRLVRLFEDRLPRHAAGVTVNTHFIEQRYLALGLPAERLVYVPNGVAAQALVAPRRHVEGLRRALGLQGQAVVAYVGTLSQTTHNVGLLLDAFALVARRLSHVRLLLVGDGEDRAALHARAQRLGIAEHTLFVGAVPAHAVPTYLALATCSVDPVADDGVARGRSPLKIVESLALGVPVVTGDVGDRREMLGDKAGVIVAPGDAQALAEGMMSVLQDAALQAKLATGASEQSLAYRWASLADDWLAVYAQRASSLG